MSILVWDYLDGWLMRVIGGMSPFAANTPNSFRTSLAPSVPFLSINSVLVSIGEALCTPHDADGDELLQLLLFFLQVVESPDCPHSRVGLVDHG
jgi:hypothetical protein